MATIRILLGDVLDRLRSLPDESVHCCVTSPPYWGLRDYGVDGQLGLEPTIEEYVERMTAVFEEVRRVLRDDGTLWLNMGDCYAAGGRGNGSPECKQRTNKGSLWQPPTKAPAGMKPKDLVGQPWMLAFALRSAGWYLRSDIIWAKPNPMPESVRDRPTKAHEYVFLMTKKPRYFFDQEAVREAGRDWGARDRSNAKHNTEGFRAAGQPPHRGLTNGNAAAGRNIRSVWKIATQPFPEAHFATFPEELPRKCIAAGTSEKGCCPECGAPVARVVKKRAGTPDPARGWDTAPGAHGREKRRDLGDKGSRTPNAVRGSAGARMGRGAGWRDDPATTPRPETAGWKATCQHVRPYGKKGPAPVPCVVLDPFGGSGTTGLVAAKMGRSAVLVELNPKYAEMAKRRIERECGLLATVSLEALEAVEA